MTTKELNTGNGRGLTTDPLSLLLRVSIPEKWFLWIRGKETVARSEEFFPVMNPATGQELCHVARAQAADVDAAVKTAHAAYSGGAWHNMHTRERGQILQRIAIYNNEIGLVTDADASKLVLLAQNFGIV